MKKSNNSASLTTLRSNWENDILIWLNFFLVHFVMGIDLRKKYAQNTNEYINNISQSEHPLVVTVKK